MARTFSVNRRRVNVIDLFINNRPGVAAYQFKYAPNFDAPFSIFETVPYYGKKSISVISGALDSEQFKNKTRFTFAPSDYALNDLDPMYIRVATVSTSGVVGADEGIQMVMPFSSQTMRPIVLKGNAPSGASLSDSLEINLPMQVTNMNIQNNGAADLYVAFEPTGAEFLVKPAVPTGLNVIMNYPSYSQIFVRGSGAITEFNAILTLRNSSP